MYPAQLTSKSVLISNNPLPEWLTHCVGPGFRDLGVFQKSPHGAANHVLVNQYKTGEGIMPHEDGLAYHPITATVSLGAPSVLDIYEKTPEGERQAQPGWRILQEERSLLVTSGGAYEQLMHGIAEVETDEELSRQTICNWNLLGDGDRFAKGSYARAERVSLTFRDVLKVSNLGNRLSAKR